MLAPADFRSYDTACDSTADSTKRAAAGNGASDHPATDCANRGALRLFGHGNVIARREHQRARRQCNCDYMLHDPISSYDLSEACELSHAVHPSGRDVRDRLLLRQCTH